jgi:tRNA pseudouridine38-40 synthase
MKYPYSYKVEIQYLGFRYSGWAKQTGHKTVHGFIDKTLCFVFNHENFKTLGSSRTDSKVSAKQNYFQLFTHEPIELVAWLEKFNSNLPADIKAISIIPVASNFNIIQAVSHKTYEYTFAINTKITPFSAPYLVGITNQLDIEKMKTGAEIFIGTHDFRNYCTELNENKQTSKHILNCNITSKQFVLDEEKINCFVFEITGTGFLRHQIRLMMGQLFLLGSNKITLEDLQHSLENKLDKPFREIAPASGLNLRNVYFLR